MNKQSVRTGLLLAIMAILMMTACRTGPPPAETDGGTDGGTNGGADGSGEVVGTPIVEEQTPISADVWLDPALATDEDSLMVNALVYDRLIHADANDEAVAGLAESWFVSNDGLEYTFNLRPGLTFHSGAPIDADAVIANFNRWFKTDDSLHTAGDYRAWVDAFGGFDGEFDDDGEPISSFDGAEKIDNLTVLLHFNRTDANVLSNLSSIAFSIIDPAALAAGGAEYGKAGGNVSGSGAYVVEWSEGNLTLNPFADFWDTVPGDALVFALQ